MEAKNRIVFLFPEMGKIVENNFCEEKEREKRNGRNVNLTH